MVDFDNFPNWSGSLYNRELNKKLLAKVQKSDLLKYRLGKSSFDNFKKKIHYVNSSGTDKIMDEDINIFSDIIQSSLENGYLNTIGLSDNNNSIDSYIKFIVI